MALAVIAVVAAAGWPSRAQAACNLIPVARNQYPSTLGGIESPITTPGKTIRLGVTSCDASAGFEPVASANAVTLTFEPPSGAGTTDVVIASGTIAVADCTLPGGRCSELSFTAPDTTAALPPNGLAGPARIVVRDAGNAVVAEIGQLFLPTLSCDRQAEGVIRQLTVLPPANSYADAVSGGATELLATVDGSGSLLVPFDYWGSGFNSVLATEPGAPVAIFLEGSADIPAMGAGDTNTILDVIAAQPTPAQFIRSYTLEGRPLPPLLRVTADGRLLGTADAVESVLRVARNDGRSGTNLYDLSDRLSASGKGPIVISTFSAARLDPLPLNSLRASSQTVAFARNENNPDPTYLNGDLDFNDLVMQVVDVETGTTTNTGSAVVQTSTFNAEYLQGLTEAQAAVPASVVDGDLLAFIELESDQSVDTNSDLDLDDGYLRVFRRNGTELTASLALEAAPVSLVDGRAAAISGDRVFFRGPSPVVDRLEDLVDPILGTASAWGVALSPDGKHLYTGASNINVFARNETTGRLTVVGAAVDRGTGGIVNCYAVSPDGKNLYATDYAGDRLLVYARDSLTGEVTSLEEHQDGVSGVDGLDFPRSVAVSADGMNVYVAGEFDDAIAIFSRNLLDGTLTLLEVEKDGINGVTGLTYPWSLVVSPDGAHVYVTANGTGIVRFERSLLDGSLVFDAVEPVVGGGLSLVMSPDGAMLYTGGPDNLVGYFRDAGTGQLTEAIRMFAGQYGFADGLPSLSANWLAINPDGGRLYAAGFGTNVAGLSILARNQRTGALRFAGAYYDGVAGVHGLSDTRSIAVSPDGRFLYTVDPNDGSITTLRTDLDLQAFDVETQSLRPDSVPATIAATASERAVVLTPESAAGDLNGDGDTADEIAQIYDASGPTDVITSLGVAAREIAISDELVALTISESGDADADLNSDGDKEDDVLAIVELPQGSIANTGLAAKRIAVSGHTVVFSAGEDAGPVGDFDNDGDSYDIVLRTYDADSGAVTDVGLPVDDFAVKGALVAFRTDENELAGGTNLNGDGADGDRVMHVYDLATNQLINTGQAAEKCSLPGCTPYEPYAIDLQRRTVSFLTVEALQGGADLDGDGDALDIVLQVFSLRSRASQVVSKAADQADPDPEQSVLTKLPAFPTQLLSDDVLFYRVRESDIGVDINDDGVIDDTIVMLVAGDGDGDGMFDDFDACVDTVNPDGLDLDGDALGDSGCDPDPSVCPPAPVLGCKQAPTGKSKLKIKDDNDDAKDSVSWKWSKGAATTLADIGDPVAGLAHYSLCAYDASIAAQPIVNAAAAAQAACGSVPCWKRAGAKGVGYKDKTGHTSSTTQVKLTSGDAGKSKVSFKAKGASFGGPTLPAMTPVVVQLIVNEQDRQDCWEATFSALQKNDGGQLSGTSD